MDARRWPLGGLLLSVAMLSTPGIAGADAQAPDTAAQIETLLDEVRSLLEYQQPEKALATLETVERRDKAFRNERLLLQAEAYLQLRKWKDVIGLATRVADGDAPAPLRAQAHNLLALALQADSGCRPEDCPRVESALREAIRLSEGKDAEIRFNLAVLLLKTGRQEEGLAMMREVEEDGVGPETSRRIQRVLAEPECVDAACAPDYALTTTDGRIVTREDLKGKAVLLYFWDTSEGLGQSLDIQTLNRLSERSEADPFALFAVSYDVDEEALADFGEKHKIECPLSYDRGGIVTSAFDVQVYPTAVVIDHRGHIVWRTLVTKRDVHPHVDAAVADAINKAREATAEEPGGRR